MATKRATIQGAVLTHSTVSQIAESLRGYTLPSLRQTEKTWREMNEAMQREGRGSPDDAINPDLERAIEEGGRWILSEVRFTDSRGVEMSGAASENLDLAFVDDAVELSMALVPYRAMGYSMKVHINLTRWAVDLKIEADEGQLVEMFDIAYQALVATVPLKPEPVAQLVPTRPFKIFIAYGGGRAWEVVRDYLRDASFQVEAFTEQERAGEITLDVVEGMIRSASVAVIVMTGADKMEDGSVHARQNVVHEAGFAQGAIGRRNTVILREAGVSLPTNVDGLTYIQFERGEVHTTKDRVVALVSRLQSLA